MAIQTAYNATMSAARAGMIADMRGSTLISRTVEDATLGFGVPVTKGTAAATPLTAPAQADVMIHVRLLESTGVSLMGILDEHR